MKKEVTKLQITGHVIGGLGHNLIYALFSGFLSIFYTDVFGLSPAFTATLFLVARIWDAVNDHLMGFLSDKTKTRIGRYRSWLIFMSPILAFILVLCFIVPDTTTILSYVYAYVTYILLGMAFTTLDVPYWTLPAVMTSSPEKRNKIFGISGFFACITAGIGAVIIPILIKNLGGGDVKTAYMLTAIIFAVFGIITYIISALLVRENVERVTEKISFKIGMKSLFKNKPLLILMGANLLGNMAFQVKIGITTYYATYALGSLDYATYLSAMLLIGMLIGAAITPMLINKFGAKKVIMGLEIAGIVFSVIYYFVGYKTLWAVMLMSGLSAIVLGAFTIVANAMTADTIDYAEVKFNQRNEGIITSTRTFITKLATAIVGSTALYVLGLFGYVAGETQTPFVLDSMQFMMSMFPAICYVIALIITIFYPLDKKALSVIENEIKIRRKVKEEKQTNE
jgi:GPH family glycoside/pentoside/hexuronide:cation symporter/probable glucitol transport protein GutA